MSTRTSALTAIDLPNLHVPLGRGRVVTEPPVEDEPAAPAAARVQSSPAALPSLAQAEKDDLVPVYVRLPKEQARKLKELRALGVSSQEFVRDCIAGQLDTALKLLRARRRT